MFANGANGANGSWLGDNNSVLGFIYSGNASDVAS